jgi:hypothetical protein
LKQQFSKRYKCPVNPRRKLNILSHKGKANQNHTEMNLIPVRIVQHQEKKQLKILARMEKEKKPLYTIGRTINEYRFYGD